MRRIATRSSGVRVRVRVRVRVTDRVRVRVWGRRMATCGVRRLEHAEGAARGRPG